MIKKIDHYCVWIRLDRLHCRYLPSRAEIGGPRDEQTKGMTAEMVYSMQNDK